MADQLNADEYLDLKKVIPAQKAKSKQIIKHLENKDVKEKRDKIKHPNRCENCRWRSEKKELTINPIVGMKLKRRNPSLESREYICNTRNSIRYLSDSDIKLIDWIGCYSCNRKDYVPGFHGTGELCIHLYRPDIQGAGYQCKLKLVSCTGVCNVGEIYSSCSRFSLKHDIRRKLNKTDKRVLEYIINNPEKYSDDISADLDLDLEKVVNSIDKLKYKKLIIR